MRLTTYADVTAVLADPRFVVPAVEDGAAPGTLAWLRATVSRFSEGEAHARRRALVAAELDRMDPAALRAEAARQAREILDRHPEDKVAAVSRRVPIGVLGGALGVADLDLLTEAVSVVGPVYVPGTDDSAAADAAVATLVGLLAHEGDHDEVVAARIAIFAQACDACAELIRRSVTHASRDGISAEPAVDWTLRFDPPVPALRRVAAEDAAAGGVPVPAGTALILDVPAANREPGVPHLTYGAGRRPCPGADQATSIVIGVVGEILRSGGG